MTTPAVPRGCDPTDPDVNLERVPHEEFLALRRTAPVFWVEQPEDARAGQLGGTGYWALSRHLDVSAVSRNGAGFSTRENGAIIRFAPQTTPDAPEHTKLRRVISRGFTPRAVGALEDHLRSGGAHRAGGGGAWVGRFVSEVAGEPPLQAIADLLGVPQEDRRRLFDWSNQMLVYDDPEYGADPEPASIETTRNAITHGMNAFFEHPEQWELFKDERPGSAVDEVIRWRRP